MIDTNDGLTIWVIFDRPKDYPEYFVARKFIYKDGGMQATSLIFKNKEIENIRTNFRAKGFSPIPRQVDDDPVIIESWI